MVVIGTSLVRGLGHKLTERGFDVTTFMYPGAELPVIRDRIPAILYNDFQPDVVVLQCAGNDIGNGRPTAQVVEHLDCLVQEIKRCSPGADIVINRIPHRGHNSNLIAEIEMVNTYITNVSHKCSQEVFPPKKVDISLCGPDIAQIDNALKNDYFWSYYVIEKSIPDGHCLLYSVICGMKSQINCPKIYDLNEIVRLIYDETMSNLDMYTDFLINGTSTDLIYYMCVFIWQSLWYPLWRYGTARSCKCFRFKFDHHIQIYNGLWYSSSSLRCFKW